MRKKDISLLFGILVIFSVFLSVALISTSPSSDTQVKEAIDYNSMVQVYKNGELVSSSPNVLFNTGAEEIENYLADGISNAGSPINITLCNATAGCGTPQADSSEAYNQFTSCGLAEIEASNVYDNGNGNWSLEHTFTASCDSLETNVSHIEYNTTNVEFAGNSFTLVTLQTNDQLTINWTIWVS